MCIVHRGGPDVCDLAWNSPRRRKKSYHHRSVGILTSEHFWKSPTWSWLPGGAFWGTGTASRGFLAITGIYGRLHNAFYNNTQIRRNQNVRFGNLIPGFTLRHCNMRYIRPTSKQHNFFLLFYIYFIFFTINTLLNAIHVLVSRHGTINKF